MIDRIGMPNENSIDYDWVITYSELIMGYLD